MIKKIAFAAAGLTLLASPIFVSAQTIPIPTFPANPTVQDLQNEIQILIQILNQLLTIRKSQPTLPTPLLLSSTFTATPTSGPAPLNVTFIGNGLSSATSYTVAFGDGTSGTFQTPAVLCPGNCASGSIGHSYASAGTYTATLSPYVACFYTNPRCLIATQMLGQVTITVTNGGSVSGAPSISGVSGPTSLQVGQQGTWSVQVNDSSGYLSYSVHWGDEVYGPTTATNMAALISTTGTLTHTYSAPGTYQPTFTVTNANGQSATASASVVVGGTTNNVTFFASPTSGTVPLAVQFTSTGAPGVDLGTAVSFGDGSVGTLNPAPVCASCNPLATVSHTYQSPGTFTAQLLDHYPQNFMCPITNPTCNVLGTATITVTNANTPSITVTAPNGGERWEEGVLNSITWTPYNYNPDVNPSRDVDAYLEQKNADGTFTEYGSVVPSGKASIHWITGYADNSCPGNTYTCEGLVPPGSNYYIRVVNRRTGASDRSDAPFTITPKSLNLQVNGSNGPVTVAQGQNISVSWSASAGVSNCSIGGNILTSNGQANMLVSNSGSTTVQSNFGGLAQGVVALNCESAPLIDNDPQAISVGPGGGVNTIALSTTVTILQSGAAQPAASLQVVSPNGGEQIPLGQSYTITYDQSGLSNVSIALYKNDQWMTWLAKSLPPAPSGLASVPGNPGVTRAGFVWTPTGIDSNLGNVYKIYITGQKADGTGYVDDKSDAPFSFVTGGTTGGSLTVSPGTQPANTIAPQGSIVPFTSFTLTNTGTQDVNVSQFTVRGNALTANSLLAFNSIELDTLDASGNLVSILDNVGKTGFDQNNQLVLGDPNFQATLHPGQSRTFTISGRMAANLSAYQGQTVSLSLASISASTAVSGNLPITGATNTINSSLNVCYPPQTATYGYKCWDSTNPVVIPPSCPSTSLLIGGQCSPMTVVRANTSATLALTGQTYYLFTTPTQPVALTYGTSSVTVGGIAGWTPIGAAFLSSNNSYYVALKHTNGSYTIWAVNSSGAYIANAIGAVQPNDSQLKNYEPLFNQDLNGDGVIGAPTTSVTFTASPSSGTAPLAVSFSGKNLPSGSYTVTFGDGTTAPATTPAGCTSACSISASHTYTTAGTYRPSITNGTQILATTVMVGQLAKIFLTSGSTWTVPSDWNSSNNTIEVIGGGGGGQGYEGGGGGGGGGYSKITNLSLTPGSSVSYQIGKGGNDVNGTDTFFNRTAGSTNTCADTVSVCAKGGSGGRQGGYGAGQQGGAAGAGVGATKFSGGKGADANFPISGGGGGGAAGPHGNGVDGSGQAGGSGDAGSGGSGGANEAAGHVGTEFDATHGSGGGGGATNSGGADWARGSINAGNYGAGGGGNNGGAAASPGLGSPGIIVITYNGLVAQSTSATDLASTGDTSSNSQLADAYAALVSALHALLAEMSR